MIKKPVLIKEHYEQMGPTVCLYGGNVLLKTLTFQEGFVVGIPKTIDNDVWGPNSRSVLIRINIALKPRHSLKQLPTKGYGDRADGHNPLDCPLFGIAGGAMLS